MTGSKRAGELCQLVESLYRAGRKVVVWVADAGRRQALDDFLWSFAEQSFVPHSIWAPEVGEVDDPVVLLGEPANPIAADHLVVADDLPPADFARSFAVVHDLIPVGADGAERSAWWDRLRAEEEP